MATSIFEIVGSIMIGPSSSHTAGMARIDALVDVEKRLPDELKAATIGGLACTKTAAYVRRRLGQ